MYNFPTPLLTLLLANRLGDSPGDAGRVALLSMMIRPPMMGLLIAITVAKQKASTTKAVITNSTVRSASGRGSTIVNSVIPKPDRSFFPTFMELTRKQATQQARDLRLNVTFVDTHETSGKEVVVRQEPKEGSNWPRDVTEVTLFLG